MNLLTVAVIMKPFPIFLSLVLTAQNNASKITNSLFEATELLSALVETYEIIIIDNGSTDDTVETLKSLTAFDKLPNLQIYTLTKEVDTIIASWVGVENSLGDFTAVIDPDIDDLSFLYKMIEEALNGHDVVFASSDVKLKRPILYKYLSYSFNWIYSAVGGINLEKEAPQFRVHSRKIINYMMLHNQPLVSYQYLPATSGFKKRYLTYTPSRQREIPKKSLGRSINKGVSLIVSTTNGPMRIVTLLALFGTIANVLYSCYVLFVALTLKNVEPGWISMSLQMSGMFFLISIVLLVLSEYVLQIANRTSSMPNFHIGEEYTSEYISRRHKLNVEEVNENQT